MQPTVLVVRVASRRAAPRHAARMRRHTAHHVRDHHARMMNACASCARHSLVMLASLTDILPPSREQPTALVFVRVASRRPYAMSRRASHARA